MFDSTPYRSISLWGTFLSYGIFVINLDELIYGRLGKNKIPEEPVRERYKLGLVREIRNAGIGNTEGLVREKD
jgi:hypothetical protein